MEVKIAKTLEDLEGIAISLLQFAGTKKKFALLAQMGAGKTTFVKTICSVLGVIDETSSPTYSLVNEYKYPGGTIRHLDLYRLQKIEEAIDLGIEDFFYDQDYLFIEWPEIIESIVTDNIVIIKISVLANGDRRLEFK